MINFDKVPDNNPYSVPDEGYYVFKCINANMRSPKDPSKKDYLNVQMMLVDKTGKKAGTFFDNFFDSDASAILYKLGRFVKAINLNLTGNVELKDIAKLLPGKEGVLEIEHRQDSRFPDDPTKIQAQVKLFGSECYWPTDQFKELVGEVDAAQIPDEDMPFSMEDGPVPPEPETTNEY